MRWRTDSPVGLLARLALGLGVVVALALALGLALALVVVVDSWGRTSCGCVESVEPVEPVEPVGPVESVGPVDSARAALVGLGAAAGRYARTL